MSARVDIPVRFPPGVVIDSHHHLGYRRTGAGVLALSAENLIQRMDAAGVDLTVVMHFVAGLRDPGDFVRANDFVAEACAVYPERLAGVAVIHPHLRRAGPAELERCRGLGFRGVKLHPIFHGYYELDTTVDPLVRVAGELDLPVVIHSDFAHHVCSPYAIAALARRCPETTIVLLHLGLQPALCHLVPEIVEAQGNVILDTSQTCDKPVEVYGHPVKVLGAERVMFGSDGPECDVSVNLRKLAAALERGALTEQDASTVLAGTAQGVFGLDLHADLAAVQV